MSWIEITVDGKPYLVNAQNICGIASNGLIFTLGGYSYCDEDGYLALREKIAATLRNPGVIQGGE